MNVHEGVSKFLKGLGFRGVGCLGTGGSVLAYCSLGPEQSKVQEQASS